MTTMAYEDFALPSTISGGGGSAHPSMAQLEGRLVHILPTGREDGVTTEMKKTPHTRLTVELTFLSGPPIDRVIDKDGRVKSMLTPPVNPGQTMTGRFMNQDWFVSRLKDKVNQPGWPGMVGIVGKIQGRSNQMWGLLDPTPAQMEQVRQWWAWRQGQPAGSTNYVPQPPAPAAAPVSPFAGQQAAPVPPVGGQQAAPVSPFAGQQAAPVSPVGGQQAAPVSPFAGQQAAPVSPVGGWAPTLPPEAQQVQAGQAPVMAAQPDASVPPWQR